MNRTAEAIPKKESQTIDAESTLVREMIELVTGEFRVTIAEFEVICDLDAGTLIEITQSTRPTIKIPKRVLAAVRKGYDRLVAMKQIKNPVRMAREDVREEVGLFLRRDSQEIDLNEDTELNKIVAFNPSETATVMRYIMELKEKHPGLTNRDIEEACCLSSDWISEYSKIEFVRSNRTIYLTFRQLFALRDFHGKLKAGEVIYDEKIRINRINLQLLVKYILDRLSTKRRASLHEIEQLIGLETGSLRKLTFGATEFLTPEEIDDLFSLAFRLERSSGNTSVSFPGADDGN